MSSSPSTAYESGPEELGVSGVVALETRDRREKWGVGLSGWVGWDSHLTDKDLTDNNPADNHPRTREPSSGTIRGLKLIRLRRVSNEDGVAGGIEYGFMSFTTDRA